MPETVNINSELNIIEVMSFGDVTEEDAKSSLFSVERLSRETGISKVLVDTTEEKSLPEIFDIYRFASNLPRGVSFAVLVKESQDTKREVHFIETVAINRGLLVQKFTSRNEALKWLDVNDE